MRSTMNISGNKSPTSVTQSVSHWKKMPKATAADAALLEILSSPGARECPIKLSRSGSNTSVLMNPKEGEKLHPITVAGGTRVYVRTRNGEGLNKQKQGNKIKA